MQAIYAAINNAKEKKDECGEYFCDSLYIYHTIKS